jgi:hypothetical protein
MNTNTNTNTNDNPKSNNIFFFLEEPPIEDLDDNNIFLGQILQEFEEEADDALASLDAALQEEQEISEYIENDYFVKKDIYFGNEELYYEQEYTVKDLMRICQYYGINKNVKAAKCKKGDIISTIIYYESCAENYEIVQKRHKLWSYMTELIEDPKMREYVYW